MKKLCALLLLTTLSACSSSPIEQYRQLTPALDLKQFLNGDLEAWGQFQDRSGALVKRFHVDMTGTWQGNKGELVENFVYDDGTKQQRIWHLTDKGNGHYEGRADDVVGVAQGQIAGSVLNWHYTMATYRCLPTVVTTRLNHEYEPASERLARSTRVDCRRKLRHWLGFSTKNGRSRRISRGECA